MSGYKKISKNIEEVAVDNPKTEDKKLIWVNINNAEEKEVEFLRRKYGFEVNHLRASSAKTTAQRPTAQPGKDYLFLILHFPVFSGGNISAGEVDFFVGHGYLITLHNNNLKALNDFFNLCKKEESSLLTYEFESSAILLYELLERLMAACYPLLDKNILAIAEAEKIIFAQDQ